MRPNMNFDNPQVQPVPLEGENFSITVVSFKSDNFRKSKICGTVKSDICTGCERNFESGTEWRGKQCHGVCW